MDWEFKPDDFGWDDPDPVVACAFQNPLQRKWSAEFANRKLKEWLDKCPTVWELENTPGAWFPVNRRKDFGSAKREAKLIINDLPMGYESEIKK